MVKKYTFLFFLVITSLGQNIPAQAKAVDLFLAAVAAGATGFGLITTDTASSLSNGIKNLLDDAITEVKTRWWKAAAKNATDKGVFNTVRTVWKDESLEISYWKYLLKGLEYVRQSKLVQPLFLTGLASVCVAGTVYLTAATARKVITGLSKATMYLGSTVMRFVEKSKTAVKKK